MTLTATQANALLQADLISDNPQYSTPEGLRSLVAQIDATGSGTITLAYSGRLGAGVSTESVAIALAANNPDIRIINHTEVATFLDTDENTVLRAALRTVFPDSDDLLRDGRDGRPQSEANKFLFDNSYTAEGETMRGLWATASANFADLAKGDVRTVTPFASPDRVYGLTELPTLLNNNAVTHIEGVAKSHIEQMRLDSIKAGLSEAAALTHVQHTLAEVSKQHTANLRFAVAADGSIVDKKRKLHGIDSQLLADDNPLKTPGPSSIPEGSATTTAGNAIHNALENGEIDKKVANANMLDAQAGMAKITEYSLAERTQLQADKAKSEANKVDLTTEKAQLEAEKTLQQQAIQAKDNAIQEKNNAIAAADKAGLATEKAQLEAEKAGLEAEKAGLEAEKASQEHAIQEKAQAIQQADKAIQEKAQAIQQADNAIQEADKAIVEADKALAATDKALLAAGKALDKAGIAGDLLALGIATSQANQAYEKGDTAEAARIMGKWSAEFSGGLAGGLLAAKLASSALTPLYLTGPAGALLASGLTLAAGFAGGFFGGQAVADFFFNDQDPAAAVASAELNSSPVVLDLNGDGIETLSQEQGIHFDLDNNGMAETVGWVGANDGLLVRDMNGNGTIDNGSELFGNHTQLANGDNAANGYEALAELDSNGDGVITNEDTAFSELKVWLDNNSDGISQQAELISLADAGIASLNTDYQNVSEDDGHGNITKQTSTATKTDGSVIDTADIWFGVNLTQTVDRNTVELSEELLALPEAYAFGNVRSLRQSMANDAVLTELVTQFTQVIDDSERSELMDSIIYQWTGSADIDPDSRTQYSKGRLDSRQLVTLENLVGRDFLQHGYRSNPFENASLELAAEYRRFKSYVIAQLLSQTDYQALFSQISINYNLENQTVEPDLTGLTTTLKNQFSNEKIDLGFVIGALQIIRGLAGYSTSLQTHYQTIKDDAVLGQYATDNWIIGTTANDNLIGTQQDDTIQGLAGDDIMSGGAGSDIYRWGWGDGNDIINDHNWTDSDNADHQDILIFGAGITANDISWSRRASHLIATLSDNDGNSQNLTIKNWFSNNSHQLEQLQLIDGTVLNKTTIESAANIIVGTAANDRLTAFSNSSSQLFGLAGNDRLEGHSGNDRLQGGAGNDTLVASGGNDVLIGGAGDDTVSGGTGDDRYYWGWGDGHDTINDYDYSDTRNNDHQDTLIFGSGITASDINWSRKNSHLVATLTDEAGTDQTLTLNNWFYGDSYQVEQLQLADGTVLDKTEVEAAANIIVGTQANDRLSAFRHTDNTLLGLAGNDRLDGNSGDDRLQGGAGNDTLVASSGNDVLIGGAGDDTVSGGTGDDRYYWGWGDGHDTINDYDYSDTRNNDHQDTLIFGSGITASDIAWSRKNSHLVATLTDEAGTDQTLTLNNWFYGDSYQVEQLQLADGTVLDKTEVEAAANIIVGTQANDRLSAFRHTDNTLLGLAGNDRLDGNSGDDRLQGGAGNDTLVASSGNDVLIGGAGDDTVSGGRGDDRYYWGWGDGHDTINDYDYSDTRNNDHQDTLIFGSGITASDINWSRKNSHLVATLTDETGTDQTLTLNNWFYGDSYQVEQLQLSDGTLLNKTEIAAAANIIVGTQANDRLSAFRNTDNTLLGLAGSDRLYGNNGADRLQGGAGNDHLSAGSGDDILAGGAGDDIVSGGTGSDSYHWGWGDGNDTINDYDYSDTRNNDHQDTLIFGSGITASDINWSRKNSHLVATLTDETGTDQTLTLNNWFYGDSYQVEQLQLADGTVLDKTEIAAAVTIQGSDTSDYVYGFYNSDDKLLGLAGNDRLYARSGDDQLTGGSGNDWLQGDSGDDSYYFSADHGSDTIYDSGRQSYDSLIYDNSFDHQQLTIEQQQNNLKIGFLGDDANSVTLRNGLQQVNLNAWQLKVGSYLLNQQQVKNYAQLSSSFAAPDKQLYTEEEKQQLANFWSQLG